MSREKETENLQDPEEALASFDHLSLLLLQALSQIASEKTEDLASKDLELIKQLTNQLKDLANSSLFSSILSQRPRKILELLLKAFRHRSPSLHCTKCPDELRKPLSDCIKSNTEPIIRSALRNTEFAEACLQEKLQSPGDAFSLSVLLCMVISALIKRGGPRKVRWWMSIDINGDLLLVKQMLQCVGFLLPEICLPVLMKGNSNSQVDIYTYMLTSVCSMMPTLDKDQMNACVLSLSSGLRSTENPLISLFASDVLKFISRIASSAFTLSVLIDSMSALNVWLTTGKGHYQIIRMTCCRLVEELDSLDKVALAESLPVRRHFFLWSHLSPRPFLQQPHILEEMYSESMLVLKEAVVACPRSTAALTCMLCRLPLALHCLCNMASLADFERKSVPGMEGFGKDVASVFLPLWKLVNAVPEKRNLESIKASLGLLLRLGTLLHSLLSDVHVSTILQQINQISEEDLWIIPFASKFVASLGRRSRLTGDMPTFIRAFFLTWCVSSDLQVRNAAISGYLQYALWTRNECSLIYGRGKERDILTQHFADFAQAIGSSDKACKTTRLLTDFQKHRNRKVDEISSTSN